MCGSSFGGYSNSQGGAVKVYTYSEARQRLSRVLDEAKKQGEIRIKRQDGAEFKIQPVKSTGSPLDVAGVDAGVSTSDIRKAIRDSRERDLTRGSA